MADDSDLVYVSGGELSNSDDDPDVVDEGNDSDNMQKLPSPRMDSTDSVSSDSSEEDVPQKKKRSTTTRRGLSALLENNMDPVFEPAQESHVYSSRVSSVLGGMRLGQGHLSIGGIAGKLTAPPQEDSDVEDDEADLFAKKPAHRSKRQASGGASKGRGGRGKASSKKVKTPEKLQPYKERLICLDSDSDASEEENSQKPSLSSLKSPSPPPPPPPPGQYNLTTKQRKPRQKKALTNAVKELDKAQILNRVRKADEEADVSIVEFTSPAPDNPRNRPISLKVRSRSGIQRFNVKAGEPFSNIISSMAAHEYVPVNRVVMFLGDRTVEPYDTPGSLDLGIADILECHILKPGEVAQKSQADTTMEDDDPDVINLKVQGQDARSRIMVSVRRSEALGKLMKKYADSQKMSLDSLKFEFDGEDISPQDTPDDLELEDNFCVDVIVAAH